MASSEAAFCAEVRYDLKIQYKKKMHVYLIHDMARSGNKPYDFYFTYRDHFCAVECKRIDGHTFNYKNMVKPHQPEFLREVIESECTGLFLICFNQYKAAFALTPDMMDNLVKENGNAIKYDAFQSYTLVDQIVKINRIKDETREGDLPKTRWHVEELVRAAFKF
jgi:penicillin-binding protein-related factor A (putative recombinase)